MDEHKHEPVKVSKSYDVAVLEGLVDAADEGTYAAAKAVFKANIERFASCPEQKGARFGVGHILRGDF